MIEKPITQYPEIAAQLQKENGSCTVYLNLAPAGDIVVDGLKRTEHRGHTHEYIQKFDIGFLRMRLRDSEFETLCNKGVLNLKIRSYFYEHNQAFLPHKTGGDAIYPAFLFIAELDKTKGFAFKSKTFRAAVSGQYSASECYSQIKNTESPVTKTQKVSKIQTKPVETTQNVTVTADDFATILIKLLNAGQENKITYDGSKVVAEPVGNSLGN